MEFCESVPADQYEQFVKASLQCNLLQSAGWAQVKSAWGHALTGLRDDDGQLVATALVLRRALPLGMSFWYVPHGPIMDYTNPRVVTEFLSGLRAFAKRSRAVAVRIDPPVAAKLGPYDSMPAEYAPHSLAALHAIESAGFEHRGFTTGMHDTFQPRFIPVTFAPEGEFGASLPKKSRTMANNARNRYVEVVYGGAELLDEFAGVVAKTEAEKSIHLRSREYYARLLRIYGDDARIYLAKLDIADAIGKYEAAREKARQALAATPENAAKKVRRLTAEIDAATKHIKELSEGQDGDVVTLAGLLMVRYGRSAEMLYAGTNRDYGNIPAQHLMWVEAMSDGFADGLENISLGGVDGSLNDSLMRFKSRFNPLVVEKLGEFEARINRPAAKLIDWYLARR